MNQFNKQISVKDKNYSERQKLKKNAHLDFGPHSCGEPQDIFVTVDDHIGDRHVVTRPYV